MQRGIPSNESHRRQRGSSLPMSARDSGQLPDGTGGAARQWDRNSSQGQAVVKVLFVIARRLSRPNLRATDAESRIGSRYESPRTAHTGRLRCANQLRVSSYCKPPHLPERKWITRMKDMVLPNLEVFRRAQLSLPPLNRARRLFHPGPSRRQSPCSSSRE